MERDPEVATADASQHGQTPPMMTVCCARCGLLHRPHDELSFDPICPACRNLVSEAQPSEGERCHALSSSGVEDAVRETSPGSFALGYLEGGEFTAFYVGRADADVNGELQAWIDAPSRPRRYAASLHAPSRPRAGPLPGLGTRALGHIPVGIDSGYTHFQFWYANSASAAFERECRDYHALGGHFGLDNSHHPEAPPGSVHPCPFHP